MRGWGGEGEKVDHINRWRVGGEDACGGGLEGELGFGTREAAEQS